jgi:hypothetical protein
VPLFFPSSVFFLLAVLALQNFRKTVSFAYYVPSLGNAGKGLSDGHELTKSKIIMADRNSCWLQACRLIDLLPWPTLVHGPSSHGSVWDKFWVPCPFPCPFPVAIVHSQRVVSIGFCSTFPQILSTLWMPVCLTCIAIWSERVT